MASNNTQNFSLRSVLEKDKLNGSNFIDWSQNLRIVLKQEKTLEVLEQPLPVELARNATAAQRKAFEKKRNDSNDVTCLMLATMSPELQSNSWIVTSSASCLISRKCSKSKLVTKGS